MFIKWLPMQGVCMYHLLFGKEEGKHAQQHVQACVRMVYMLHLYVHIHWISLFYAQDVNTSCAAYPHWTWLEPSGSAAHQSDKQDRRTASLLCILGCRCRQNPGHNHPQSPWRMDLGLVTRVQSSAEHD
ncbi:TPA: hypothetical protein ACH3X2_005368 [Trebouxia sp. C0005]